MSQERYDHTPVPHAATIETGTECVRRCKGCSFNETALQNLSAPEISQAIETLSTYWDAVGGLEDHQLIGNRIVELIGGAGVFNKLTSEEIGAILEIARANDLFQFAVMCDAEKDEEAISELFRIGNELEKENASGMKTVVALSVDALPKVSPETDREKKSNPSWEMVENRNQYIRDPETQKFRVFTTISKSNLSEIPEIAKRVLESEAVLFIAPLTMHSSQALANTGVAGRLIMGDDIEILLDETNREEMEGVITALRELKKQYPEAFLNADATFENMLAACKPIVEGFQGNCRERCAFVTKDGEELVATPNFRVMKREDNTEMTLGICTGMIGSTDEEDDYANTSLSDLIEIAEGNKSTIDLYRSLTASLAKAACLGCNYRTAIDMVRGEGLR